MLRARDPFLSILLGLVLMGVFGLVLIGVATPPTHASIVANTPTNPPTLPLALVVIAPPPSVVLGALQSDTAIRVFQERRNHTLVSPVTVNATAAGTYSMLNQPIAPFPTIAAGTAVDSYFIHFDPVSGTQMRSGTVTFDRDILGVILYDAELDASDSTLGAPSTLYPTLLADRELDISVDSILVTFVTIGADQRTLSLRMLESSRVDQVRVITAANVAQPGVTVTIFGDFNQPTIRVSNDALAELTHFNLTIGDTRVNYDCIFPGSGFIVGAGVATLTLNHPDTDCTGGARPNDVDYGFTGFEPGEVFGFRVDVDIDNSDTVENYRVRLFDLGALVPNSADNAKVTLNFGDSTTAVAFLPDFGVNAQNTANTYQLFIPTNQRPVALCSNPTVAADSQCQAEASVDAGSYDPDGDPVTLAQAPLGPYGLGPTPVVLTVTDSPASASAACPATVVVFDDTDPAVDFPSAAGAECTSLQGAAVTFAVTAEDNCSTAPAVSCAPNSGEVFPIGLSNVDCTATDESGNSSLVTFGVTVSDTTQPSISVAPPAPAECTSPAGAAVSFNVTANDLCSTPTVACTPGSGGTFPIGTSSVNCTATDPSGNAAEAGFGVTVRDTVPPVIMLPAGVSEECTSPEGAQVSFSVGAIDVCSAPVVVCSAGSGSSFPIGTTTVSCTATDRSSNATGGAFGVTVRSTAPTLTAALAGNPLVAAVNTSVAFSVSFADNLGDAHTATWDFGDGGMVPVPAAMSPLGTNHVYTAPGVYTVKVVVTDRCGNSISDSIVVVVFDPAAGFTTGGGWFVPDAESFIDGVPVTNTIAKANFGFIVKYKQGQSTPGGNLEFQYKAGDVNLKSSVMDWMVTSATKVRFKGLATINGTGQYTFKVTAEDNGQPGTNDRFQIEIWMGVVDTENGPPTPKHMTKGVLGGGNIQIHK